VVFATVTALPLDQGKDGGKDHQAQHHRSQLAELVTGEALGEDRLRKR
jgi:hypothetical protein